MIGEEEEEEEERFQSYNTCWICEKLIKMTIRKLEIIATYLK